MFTCSYCGTQFTEHKPNCSNCGAAIKLDSAGGKKITDKESIHTLIYKICDQYQGEESIYFDDTVNAARMKNAVSHLNIPAGEPVIMLYDDTVFNSSNKIGFAICPQGLYWKNDWTVETKRNYPSWEDFAKRDIKLNGLQIDLGKGDNIGVAGCGSNATRKNIEKLLNEIKDTIIKRTL